MKKICVFILLLTMLLVNNVYAFDFGFTNNVVKVSYIDDVIRTDKTLNTDIIDNYSNQVNKYNVAVNTNQNNELLISGNVNNKNFIIKMGFCAKEFCTEFSKTAYLKMIMINFL